MTGRGPSTPGIKVWLPNTKHSATPSIAVNRLSLAERFGAAMPWLDAYGASGVDEFFAVASEEFIECSGDLRTAHPRLYSLLREFYGIDPVAWSVRAFVPGRPPASGKADTLAGGRPGTNA